MVFNNQMDNSLQLAENQYTAPHTESLREGTNKYVVLSVKTKHQASTTAERRNSNPTVQKKWGLLA